MTKEFQQIEWDAAVEEDCRQLVRLAVREDLDRVFDWTTVCLVPPEALARADVVSRSEGIVAGLRAAELAFSEMDINVHWTPTVDEGQRVARGQVLAAVEGPARSLLSGERIVLNLIGRLSGIATLTRRYVDAVAGSGAKIYDTRKTTPGWRRLEKYAVRLGGGNNHRTGLFDAILIKDNHLAFSAAGQGEGHLSPAQAVRKTREFVESMAAAQSAEPLIVEVEVDTLEQLAIVLGESPDIVLLDNMPPEVLRQAVALRDRLASGVELEASGGVTLETVARIAATGVERISVGALTHSAVSLDVGLDWR